MPRSRSALPLVPAPCFRRIAARLTPSLTALLAAAMLTVGATAAEAQDSDASATPLHLAASRFEFVVSGDSQPPAQALRVHNGGTAGFTGVRLTRLTYVDPARGAKWLVAQPRQTAVAPDELATVGTLCVNAAGLKAGTYHATAAVAAREVPEPVAVEITLVVTDGGARARHAAPRCTAAVKK